MDKLSLHIGAALLLLAGCGGTPAPDAAGSAGRMAELAQAPHAQAALHVDGPAGSPVRYELVILNDRAVHQDLDQLDPRHGKGYQPLRAFIYVKGRPRSKSPVNSIKPICATATECEYLPPREAGFAERYTISVDDPSVVQLSADKDVVVISPRQLQLARPATVSVTLTVPGQAPVVKRVIYGAAT